MVDLIFICSLSIFWDVISRKNDDNIGIMSFYSILGVLKNAIDWASRPYGDSAFDGKPVAIMGASVGMLGTARAQYHLRQSFVFLNMRPLNQPEVMVPFANEKIDQDGKVKDEKTKKKIGELLESLVAWTKKLKSEKS
jgi:chromate reductase